jgi:dTMP kinase
MFIVFEGADCTGKTTLAKKVAEKIDGIYTKEPVKSLQKNTKDILKFFLEDRKEHNYQIKQWLDEGKSVICDRYKYSTVVYQQLLFGLSVDQLVEMCKDDLVPDRIILLDTDIETIMDRLEARGDDLDIFETKEIQQKVLELYRQIPKLFPNENFHILNDRLCINQK